MSQEHSKGPRNGGGQGRQGNNRNRNRNRGGNRNRQGNRGNQQGNRPNSQGGSRTSRPQNPQQRRQQKPVPLTLWEKILDFFGLYKKPTRPPRRKTEASAKLENDASSATKSSKTNTRNAKGKGPKQKRVFPVETPRLYIGNLSYDADESTLEELFKGVGTVRSVEIVYNRHTHRSKGFGFLEMQNVEEAKRAVEVLHDQPFMGRNLIVNGANSKPKENRREEADEASDSVEAKERPTKPRESSGSREKKSPQKRNDGKRNNPARLHIGNLSPDASESEIEEHFKGVGNVRRVELVYDKESHRSKGFGFVEMQKAEDAKRAVEVLNEQFFLGRKMTVADAKGKREDEAQQSKPANAEPKPEKASAELSEVAAPKQEAPAENAVEAPITPDPTPEVEAVQAVEPEPVVEDGPQAEAAEVQDKVELDELPKQDEEPAAEVEPEKTTGAN